MKLRRLILPVFAAGLALLMAAGLPGRLATTQAASHIMAVTLLGDAENPPVKDGGGASARFVFDDETRKLDYSVTVSGLSADLVTASHIHRGAVGVNGPIIYPLSTVGFTQVSGSLTLTEADVADLKAGNLYVNVHSKDNPGGYARAQLYLDPEAGALATVQGAIAAWNKGDGAGFVGYWTDSGLAASFDGSSRDEVVNQIPMFSAQQPITLLGLNNIQVLGTKVTGILDLQLGNALQRTRETFALDKGAWKISNEEELTAPILSGSAVVDVKLQEFSFGYDSSQVVSATGPFALKASNIGKQTHEIQLVRIDNKTPILDLLHEDEPEGVSFLGGADEIKPGESKTVSFVSPLNAGRYAFVCFAPDTDGTPHALKGMYSEFTIGGGQ